MRPLCACRPFFRLCRPPFSPPIFPFASVRSPLLFASSLSVFLVVSVGPFFYLRLCPPSSPSFSPLSPAHLYLSAFGAHRSLCALSAHPASVHFSFPPLSPAVFYAFWQSTFSPISLRLVFPSPLAVWLSPRFRPPFFPFAAVCPPTFSPPFSAGFPCLPVWPFRTCYPSFSPPFPFALSAQFSSPPLHPPISLHLLSIPLFPRPCPPTRRERGEAP